MKTLILPSTIIKALKRLVILLATAGLSIGLASDELKIPERDSKAGAELIDLTKHYNAALTETWHPGSNLAGTSGNDVSELPRGIQKLDGVDFNVRGLIQVSGNGNSRGQYPEAVKGIRVGLKRRALHFLHGAGFVAPDGQRIGTYVVHYADGQTNEIPIVYGEDVRDWWAYERAPKETKRARVAWTGKNKATTANGIHIQLFRLPWSNPRPDVAIESLDFKAVPARSMPFLIAITAEPGNTSPSKNSLP